MKRLLLRILRERYNRDLVPADDPDFWWTDLLRLMREHDVTVALDVGANVGAFGARLRQHGYEGTIVSFEPLKESFDLLCEQAADDPKWECHNLALGAVAGTVEMNVAANEQQSSSVLPMLASHEAAAPHALYVGTEQVTMSQLDDVPLPEGRCLLKLDVQGYEAEVLQGATRTLRRVQIVQTELSLRQLYADQPLMLDSIASLHGFVLLAVRPAFRDAQTDELLQLDGIFARSSRRP